MRIPAAILIILMIQACNPDGIGCFKPAGETTTETRSVLGFREVNVKGNLNVKLVSGDANMVVLTAGFNELIGLYVEVKDSILFLDNLNTCNWTRKYQNPTIEISYQEIDKIVLQGSGLVSSEEVIVKDRFSLISLDGSGDFDLTLEVNNLSVGSNQITNFYLDGRVNYLRLGFYYSEGRFLGENLLVSSCNITHLGTNEMRLNVSDELSGSILSFGDVALYGQPPSAIDVEMTSRGKILNRY